MFGQRQHNKVNRLNNQAAIALQPFAPISEKESFDKREKYKVVQLIAIA